MRAGTVNRGRSSVFEHGDFSDVVRIHKRHIVHGHAVDNDKGIRGLSVRQSTQAANLDGGITGRADSAGIGSHGKTGYGSLKSLGNVAGNTVVHSLGDVDGGDCAGEVGALLAAVADGDELVELLGGGLEVDGHAVGGGHVGGLVAHVAELELGPGGDAGA